jgi:hypothetical protein
MTAEKNEKIRKEKLSIYLAKAAVTADDALIKTENAKAPISIKLAEGEARLYIKKEPPKSPPPWTKFFTAFPDVPDDAFGSSNSVGARVTASNLLNFQCLTLRYPRLQPDTDCSSRPSSAFSANFV